VSIHGKISLSDYLAGVRLHYRPRPWLAAAATLTIVCLVWLSIRWHDWGLALLPAYVAAVLLIFVPLRARRSFRQNKGLSEPMTIELRDDGLYLTNTYSNGLMPWSHVHKLKSNSRITLIYRTGQMFHLIPSRFFETVRDYEVFVQTVKARTNAAT
jgi:YcxB-like protein